MAEINIEYKDILQKVKSEEIPACIEYLKPFTDSSVSALKNSVQTILKECESLNKSKGRDGIDEKFRTFQNTVYTFPTRTETIKKENLIPQLNVQQTRL